MSLTVLPENAFAGLVLLRFQFWYCHVPVQCWREPPSNELSKSIR